MDRCLICPHCGRRMKDYAIAKALRESVGFIEEMGREVGPTLGSIVGRMTGIRGSGAVGKSIMKNILGQPDDPLVSKTVRCPHCKKNFQA